jgi:hypothetical protein
LQFDVDERSTKIDNSCTVKTNLVNIPKYDLFYVIY